MPVTFERRLKEIVRRHGRMGNGVVHRVGPSGLIVAVPRVYAPKFPFKGIVMLAAAAFLFKAYIYADLGQADYVARVSALSGLSLLERVGAWIMQPDVATVFVADILTGLGV